MCGIPLDMALAGRVAIVTGATRGIGRALALAFASEGADVVVTGKTTTPTPGLEGTITSVADEVEQLGVRALPCQLDVRNDAQILDVVDATARELGPPAILVNNASALWWKSIEQVFDNVVNWMASLCGCHSLTKWCVRRCVVWALRRVPRMRCRQTPMDRYGTLLCAITRH